ncbi:MAG: hypothetical protein HS113_03070 [Verrucomicrobiales bacterium]|nr:hypothetical protein [Verrucomicrobiales bacterium]
MPTGPVFFRRAGPERWTDGSTTALAQQGIRPDAYPAEPAITVYDALGFREETGRTNWTVSVA